MKKAIFAISLILFNVTCSAKDLTDVTSDGTACITPSDRDIGICIQNLTGEPIEDNKNNIRIGEETSDQDGGSGVQFLSYSKTINSHFVTLATSKKAIAKQYLSHVGYFLEYNYKTLYKCEVNFYKDTPPYKHFATLILKKNNDGYYCQLTL